MANLETLRNLCLASKNMFAVAGRHLYTQFIVYSRWTGPDMRKFLIKILKEPYLGSQLKFISYETWIRCGYACKYSSEEYDEYVQDDGYPPPPHRNECLPEAESILIERARDITGPRFPVRDGQCEMPFVEHLRRRCPAAQFILLLCTAPNLEILTLALPEPEGD
jgi:hypothetical protein